MGRKRPDDKRVVGVDKVGLEAFDFFGRDQRDADGVIFDQRIGE